MLKILDNWGGASEAPSIKIRLAPNRSLDSHGTKVVFAVVACGFLLPIIPFIGSPIGTTLTIFLRFDILSFSNSTSKKFSTG